MIQNHPFLHANFPTQCIPANDVVFKLKFSLFDANFPHRRILFFHMENHRICRLDVIPCLLLRLVEWEAQPCR